MKPNSKEEQKKQPRQVQVKVTDDVLGGVYSNHMMVTHTREEFFLEFFTMLPNVGKLASRVIVSPGHLKRILGALSENLRRYEENFGSIQEAAEPGVPATTLN